MNRAAPRPARRASFPLIIAGRIRNLPAMSKNSTSVEATESRATNSLDATAVHPARVAEVARETSETNLAIRLDLDGTGRFTGGIGVPFFEHMLNLLAR